MDNLLSRGIMAVVDDTVGKTRKHQFKTYVYLNENPVVFVRHIPTRRELEVRLKRGWIRDDQTGLIVDEIRNRVTDFLETVKNDPS